MTAKSSSQPPTVSRRPSIRAELATNSATALTAPSPSQVRYQRQKANLDRLTLAIVLDLSRFSWSTKLPTNALPLWSSAVAPVSAAKHAAPTNFHAFREPHLAGQFVGGLEADVAGNRDSLNRLIR